MGVKAAAVQHGERAEQRLVLYSPACEHDTPAKLQALLEPGPDREQLALAR